MLPFVTGINIARCLFIWILTAYGSSQVFVWGVGVRAACSCPDSNSSYKIRLNLIVKHLALFPNGRKIRVPEKRVRLFVSKPLQPVEKVFCRALRNRKTSHVALMWRWFATLVKEREHSHLLSLSSLVFQQAGWLGETSFCVSRPYETSFCVSRPYETAPETSSWRENHSKPHCQSPPDLGWSPWRAPWSTHSNMFVRCSLRLPTPPRSLGDVHQGHGRRPGSRRSNRKEGWETRLRESGGPRRQPSSQEPECSVRWWRSCGRETADRSRQACLSWNQKAPTGESGSLQNSESRGSRQAHASLSLPAHRDRTSASECSRWPQGSIWVPPHPSGSHWGMLLLFP